MVKVTRRDLLAMSGGTVVGAALGGAGMFAIVRQQSLSPASSVTHSMATVQSWLAGRSAPYYIADRGVADLVPEHTLPSYLAALDQGAQAVSLSVVMSSDHVLYCLEDLTLNRTTTLTGATRSRSAAQLDQAKVRVPRLGSAWLGPNMPAVPRLDRVLEEIGGRAVLCLEARDDAAYPRMIAAIRSAGLRDSVIIRAAADSNAFAEAKKAGFPTLAYFSKPGSASAASIKALVRRLDPRRDALLLQNQIDGDQLSADLIRSAAGSGIDTWIAPVHRRSDVQVYRQLGVAGMVTPGIGYLQRTAAQLTSDSWGNGAISAGELTKDPLSDRYALDWTAPYVLGLDAQDVRAFVLLGQFCPIVSPSYRITVDLSFDPLPKDTWQNVSIAFGHTDDRYYEHRLGSSDGYHALLRADGSMAIGVHLAGDENGRIIAERTSSAPMKPGLWSRVTLDVTPDAITWSRDDGTTLTAKDRRFRGGYFHIGRSSDDGGLHLRSLSIT